MNNPTVTNFNFGGNPPTNFGWRLQAADVPEPGSVALLVGISVSGAGLLVRKRRARKYAGVIGAEFVRRQSKSA